ncbi:hypothetical protein L210DRAFT_3650488 [Boletus edulis BED1]|uniref:Zinc finger DNA-directed DNA polymerase family B alpha domain-containing protein n=1 Tax=Boletus edulis BED1 TaxID=1328754 RepID=A0AAD4GAL6_BOLED|nr:hypothetical protein L210DRAFT_3650488 [Boletus edulis BED1]
MARFEHSDAELYNQLRYFAMLFDPDKAKMAVIGSARFEGAGIAACRNLTFLSAVSATAHKYIGQRRWADLGTLFNAVKKF